MVERSPKRAQRTPMAVSGKSPTKSVEICAVLERDRANDGAIARIRIGRRIGLVVVQEDFANAAIREASDSRCVPQPSTLEVECRVPAPIREPLAVCFGRDHDCACVLLN
jgi:hypothetical protein